MCEGLLILVVQIKNNNSIKMKPLVAVAIGAVVAILLVILIKASLPTAVLVASTSSR